ncbi:MAG: tripartite tricarboxylate transporter substrate binding protein [Xanthobacteraceae bacterium]|nr:tripartite tricarboxylate transporter substrate binding protein [Xanthobacteraceae bacterium]
MRHVYTLLICLAAAVASAAGAQPYPSRTITVVVPFAAGGAVDVMARLFAAKMSEGVGQPVVVENRGGGGAIIGIGAVATGDSDGYRILYSPNSVAILPALYHKLSFNPEKDLVPVSQALTSTLVLAAHPKLGVSSVQELISFAKANPGKLNFGSAGVADPLQLGVEMLKTTTGIQAQAIPFRGQGPMFTALLAGEIDIGIVSLQTALPSIQSGMLRPLGVTGGKRAKSLPQVPTIAEAGVPGYELTSWHGFFAPARTPSEVIARLHGEVVRAATLPDVRLRIESAGNEVIANSPQEFEAIFRSDVQKFKKLVQEAKLPAQD